MIVSDGTLMVLDCEPEANIPFRKSQASWAIAVRRAVATVVKSGFLVVVMPVLHAWKQ